MANSTYKKTFNNGIVSEFANNNVKLINIQDIPNLIKDDFLMTRCVVRNLNQLERRRRQRARASSAARVTN